MLEISCLGLHPLGGNPPFETLESAVMFVIPMQGCWFGGGVEYFAKRLTEELMERLSYNAHFCCAMFPTKDPERWVREVNGLATLFHILVCEALKSQDLPMGEWASHTGLAIHLLVSWDANLSNKRTQS